MPPLSKMSSSFVLLYYYKKCYFKIDKVTHKQGLDLINHFI